jgi:hypothetical protein
MYLEAKPPKLRKLVSGGRITLKSCNGDILDFVEDHAAGLVDAEQSHHGSHQGQQPQELPVRAGKIEDVMVADALGRVA